MKVEESLNVTFDESPPPPKTSPLEDDDLAEEEAIKIQSKEIAKPIIPPSESDSEEESDPEQAHRDKDINKNVDTFPRYKNDNHTRSVWESKDSDCCQARETIEDTDEEIDEHELEAHYSFMEKILVVLPAESGSDAEPLEKVQYDAEYNVFVNETQHSEQPKSINNTCLVENVDKCDDERVVLANLIENLKLDTDENKRIQRQLKKANTTLSHELQECKYALKDCKSSLGESNKTRDRYLVALHDKEVELQKYKIFKNHTIENDTLERKLKETLGLLSQKEHDIKEGLKIKAYKISIVKDKNDELVKQSLLTKPSYEGLFKEKDKVIKDLKLKEGHDLDKLIALEKQLKFLNETVYKRNQSIQTIHLLTPKGSTYNGRPFFANPMYLKKAQSEKPGLYEIPYDKCDLANIFVQGNITIKRVSYVEGLNHNLFSVG
ncbi:hypothetical protein Tco_0919527 [Tanacetum coccineum]